MGIADGDFVRVTLAPRLDRAGREGLAPRDAGLVLHPVPLPRGGREPAHDRRDRPGREDPRVQVLRRARSSRPAARRTRCPTPRRRSRERADGRGQRPRPRRRGARGQVPRPVADPAADGDPARARLAAARGSSSTLVARLAPAAVRDRGARLVLPALPHLAARAARGRRLPRPLVLARARPRRDPGGRDGARGLLRRALRPGAGRDRRGALPGGATAARAGGPNDPYASADEHYRVLPHVRRRPGAGARRLRPEGHGRRRLPDRARSGRWSAARTTRSST